MYVDASIQSGTSLIFIYFDLTPRGTTILVLGILGIVLCPICGIIAWVMANADLPKMTVGLTDPEGMGQTNAGKICGIVATVLGILGIIVAIIYFVFIAVVVGAAATQGV